MEEDVIEIYNNDTSPEVDFEINDVIYTDIPSGEIEEMKRDIAQNTADILLRSLITETGNKIDLEINSSTYVLVAKLYDKNDNLISTSSEINLPIESMVIGATYDAQTKEIVLTLQSGDTVRVNISDLISGLVNQDDFDALEERVDIVEDRMDVVEEIMPTISATGTEITLQNTKKAGMKVALGGNTEQATAILPSGYTQVDYIASSGTQYIDTGYKHNTSKTSYEATLSIFSLINTTNTLFGARTTHNGTEAFYLGLYRDGKSYGCIGGNKVEQIGWTASIGIKYHIVYDATTGLTVDGINYPITSSSNITYDKNDYIFALNSNGNVLEKTSYKLYAFKIRDNGTLVRDFIPCYRNSDSVVGLYDLVNGVFYTNQGTGAFTYGSVVSIPNPDYPQDIHTVTGENTVIVAGVNYPINLGTIELCKIGTYQDYIYKSGDKWYLHSTVGKVVLNGSETWAYQNNNLFNVDNIIPNHLKTLDVYAIKSSYYYGGLTKPTNQLFLDSVSNYNYACGLHPNGTTIRFKDTRYSDVNDFKIWLSTHNVTIYRVLEVPTDIEITDTTLISQLEALYLAKSAEGTTTITQTNADEPFILTATAFINANFEVVSNKVTTLSSSSTDTQYPSAKCVYDLVGNIESLLTALDVRRWNKWIKNGEKQQYHHVI